MSPRRGRAARALLPLAVAVAVAACASGADRQARIDTHLQLGIRYLNLNRLESAKENLLKVVEQEPRNTEAHNALAYLYERIQRHTEALHHYRRALELAPDDLGVQNNFGRFLCARREFAEGLALLNKAMGNLLNDRPWLAATNLGLCHQGMGQQQKAKGYFKQALQLNPNYAPALLEMQRISYQEGEFWAAKGYLQRYLQVAAHTPASLWIAFKTEQALGNLRLANEHRNELLESFPASPEAQQLQQQRQP